MSKNYKDKQRRRVDMVRRVSESGEELCPVCSDVIKIYAIGECDHPICFRCSTRMRVLCDQMYCAICRADLPKVAFIRSGQAKFEELDLGKFKLHHRHKIFFETESAKLAFFELQEHRCSKCPDLKAFRAFQVLRDHMRKEHNLHCCDICVRHIKIFSKDRKFYDRKALGEHRRVGDSDDRSHKGHPLCKFCDERYLDNDELVKHLRKQHYYCHFCEADGICNEYYDTYPSLRDHFGESHYLCEEDECYNVQFTNAFRDEIDYKAHKAAMHSKNLKKAMAKAARTLEIDFSVARRQPARRDMGVVRREDYSDVQQDDSRRGAYGRGRAGGMSRRDRERQREEDEIQRALTASLNQATYSSVSVVDPSLLQPTSMSDSTEDLKSIKHTKKSTNTDSDSDIKAKREKKTGKRSPEEQRRLFEEATRNDYVPPTGSVVDRGMRDDPDMDSDDFRVFLPKHEIKELPTQPEVQTEPVAKSSMAQKIKLANNFSVQSGAMERDDFPSLGGAKPSITNYPQIKPSSGTVATEPVEDFPTLGGKAKAKPNAFGNRPQSAGSSWNKGAPAIKSKPVTTRAKTAVTSSWSVSKPVHNNSNSSRTQSAAVTDTSTDFPSLGSIGDALLKGAKVTGSATEALSKYSSSTSATQPVTSNVKVVKEKPHAATHNMASSKHDFSGFTKVTNNTGDFPELSGSLSNSNAKPVQNVSKSWGPKPKPVETKQEKKQADSGILKMKTKLKKKNSQKSTVVRENSSDSLKSKQTSYSSKESEAKFNVDTEKDSSNSKGKSKIEKGTLSDIDNSSNSLKSAPNNVRKEEKSKGNEQQQDPIQAFLRHLQEEEKKFSGSSQETEAKDSAKNKFKKDKTKKKKKKDKDGALTDSKEEDFFPGPVKSLGGAACSAAENENVPSWTPTISAVSSENASHKVNSKTANLSTAPVDTKQMSVNKSFPSFHEVSSNVSIRAVDLNEFPTLGSASGHSNTAPPPGLKAPPAASREPPPGFKNAVISKPPPGFNTAAAAPPGFAPGASLGLSGIANGVLSQMPGDGAAAELNSNIGLTNATLQYEKPKDFDQRNRELIQNIREFVKESQFNEFKHYSREFRHGEIDASSYYKQCALALGRKNFDRIFPELLVLLPEIDKQQQLLQAHNEYLKNDPIIKLSAKSADQKSWNTGSTFFTCPICRQVLLTQDSQEHTSVHNNEAEFPVLGQSQGKGIFGMGSWGIKT